MKKVSIIIVNFNGIDVLVPCLTTLLNSIDDILEIIIVDNASTDGSKDHIKEVAQKYPLIKLVENTENKGFAEANNIGLQYVSSKYVLFLNNDTLLPQNFVKPMIACLNKNMHIAAVQPQILFPDLTIDSVGSYFTPTGFLYHKAHRQKPNKMNSKDAYVYSLKGACMLWRKDVLEEIGGFDESYFAYFEETDLCHRAINVGYKLLYTHKSKIIHLGGYTSNNMDRAFVQFYNTKNRFETYIKNLQMNELITVLPVHLILTELLAVSSLIRNVQLGIAIQKGILVGIFQGIIQRGTYQFSRKHLSFCTKKPDLSYYLALFSSLKNYEKLW